MSIRCDRPFILVANCSIIYNGRAKSSIGNGRRVIIHKVDGTLIIHRAILCTALNYNGPGSKLEYNENRLISTSKNGEQLIININSIDHYHEVDDWSSDSIELKGSESHLREWIIDNISDLIDVNVIEIHKEYPTRVGNVDLVVIDDNRARHCIEIKRVKASIPAVYQLNRYISVIDNSIGYLAAPSIGDNALDALNRLGYSFIKTTDDFRSQT